MSASAATYDRAGSRAGGTVLDEARLGGLRTVNLIVGLVHLVQAGLLLALSNDFALPVTRSFLNGCLLYTSPSPRDS